MEGGADAGVFAAQQVAWRPDERQRTESVLGRFLKRLGLDDAAQLGTRAAADPAWFWDAVVRDLGISFQAPYTKVLDLTEGPEFPRWFRGGQFNVAHACVDVHAAGAQGEAPAVIWEGEDGTTRRLTFRQLADEVGRAAKALVALGVGHGDAVGIFLPMLPETVIAALAVAKIGAVMVPIFSGYGPGATATRLNDADAKLVVTADGFWRRGRVVEMKRVADAACAQCPSVLHQLVVRRIGLDCAWQTGRDHDWAEAVGAQTPDLETARLDPETMLMILYTSGTTGKPKGALHVHAGFPVKAAQDLAHCFDLRSGDRLFWFTDMGWMMGPWAVFGGLMRGAAVVLYEGTPDHPGPDRLWRLISAHGVTHFGISPTAIRALMAHGEEPVRRWPMQTLRVLGSTGEPWNPEPWQWFFQTVGRGRLPIVNYSGGTEISGGIVSCFPTEPIKPCSFRGAIPGLGADVVDDAGQSVREQVGELVIRGVWPGMTRGFWRDRERYLETYFRQIPGVWYHGDWAYVDSDGFWYILGRSDDTIKVAGKRVGPAEIESALVGHPAVREAAAVAIPDPVKGSVVGCFAVLHQEVKDTEGLVEALRQEVARQLGKALAPAFVHVVGDLPRTRNGKILRRLARRAYLGEDLGDVSSLENQAALDEIAALRPASH